MKQKHIFDGPISEKERNEIKKWKQKQKQQKPKTVKLRNSRIKTNERTDTIPLVNGSHTRSHTIWITEIAISMEQWQPKEKKTDEKKNNLRWLQNDIWLVGHWEREKKELHIHTLQLKQTYKIQIVLQSGLRVWLLPTEWKKNTIIARTKIHRHTMVRCHFRVLLKTM